jgi:hypothetical protein
LISPQTGSPLLAFAVNAEVGSIDLDVTVGLLQPGLALGDAALANDTKNLAARAAVTSSHNNQAINSRFSSESPRRARL